MKTIFFSCTLSLMVCFFCTISLQAQSLPSAWQPGMMFSITTEGGMRPHTHSIVITDGDSYESNTGEGDNDRAVFSFSKEELDSLIRFLQQQHISGITTTRRKQLIADMGTTTMELSWDSHTVRISTGASIEIAQRYIKDKTAIDHYIYQMIAAKKK